MAPQDIDERTFELRIFLLVMSGIILVTLIAVALSVYHIAHQRRANGAVKHPRRDEMI